jgi:hypothetical protein
MNRLLRPKIGPKNILKAIKKSCGFKEAKKWEN